MKNTFMQKYVAVALATAMIGSMGVTAFAAPQTTPVNAASTRASSETEALREQLKKAEEALKEAETKLRAALKEAGMNDKVDLSTPAAVDRVVTEAAAKKAEADAAVKEAEDAIVAAGGSTNPDVNDKPEVKEAQKAWEDAKVKAEEANTALEQAKDEFKPAEAKYKELEEIKNTTGNLDNAYKFIKTAEFTTVNQQAADLDELKEQIKNGLTGVDASLKDQIVDEIVGELTNTDPANGVTAENVKIAAKAVEGEKGTAASTAAQTALDNFNGFKDGEYKIKNDAVTNAQTALDNANKTVKEKKDALDKLVQAPAAVAVADFGQLNQNLKDAKAKQEKVAAVDIAAKDVKAKQIAVKNAQDAVQGSVSGNGKYKVKDVRLGSKVEDKFDGDYYLYYLLDVDGFGIMDNATGNNLDYDDIEDMDDLKLTVKITDGSDYVKDYYIDEIDSATNTSHSGKYAVIIELKDNNTTKKQKIKGTITIKNKTKKLDDVDFSYNYDVKPINPDEWDGEGDCTFDVDEAYINLVDFNAKGWKVANFKKAVENIELEDNNGFYFDVKASDQGKLNLSFDNVANKSVVRKAPVDADLTFYNFYGYPEFDFTGTVTITPEEDDVEYFVYKIDKKGNLSKVNAKLNDDGDAYEFKTRTLGCYVLSDMELDLDDEDTNDNNNGGTSGQPSGPVEDPTIPGGTTGGKPNPGTGL